MAKSKDTKKQEQEEYDKHHRGEGSVFLGIVQLILVITFIAGSFLISGILKSNKQELGAREANNRVLFAQTQVISPAPYQIAFETTGVVEARSEVAVTPQVSGNVIAVNEAFFNGGTFKAGEVLFEIEPLDFELEMRRLQSAVAQARTAFNIEEAESEAAVAEWEQINGDQPVPALVARKPQKAEAWANLKSAKAQLENAELDLKRTKFSLPFAGRVLSADLEKGQYISAGQSYATVYDIDNLEVRVSLKDEQLNWLTASDDADITIEYEHFGEAKRYDGFVKRGVSSLNSQTRFATVSIGFAEKPDDLLPGTFVTLNIQGPQIENAVALPVSALQKSNKIWAVDDENRLYMPETNIVFNDDENVVVKGVGEPIEVVISKLPGAIEGMVIKTSDEDMDIPSDE